MSKYSTDLWQRAVRALETARIDLKGQDQDAAASRAYYAAFYAVSALLDTEGKDFTKHSAVEAAVFRDMVKTGRWTPKMGAEYRALRLLRDTGDYGRLEHVRSEQAEEAIQVAQGILDAVLQMCPGLAETNHG